MWAINNKSNMNILAYNVANDIANTLFNDATYGASLSVNGKPRIHPSQEYEAFDIAKKRGYNVSPGDINNKWPNKI
jgi:hypothetical protein